MGRKENTLLIYVRGARASTPALFCPDYPFILTAFICKSSSLNPQGWQMQAVLPMRPWQKHPTTVPSGPPIPHPLISPENLSKEPLASSSLFPAHSAPSFFALLYSGVTTEF